MLCLHSHLGAMQIIDRVGIHHSALSVYSGAIF